LCCHQKPLSSENLSTIYFYCKEPFRFHESTVHQKSRGPRFVFEEGSIEESLGHFNTDGELVTKKFLGRFILL